MAKGIYAGIGTCISGMAKDIGIYGAGVCACSIVKGSGIYSAVVVSALGAANKTGFIIALKSGVEKASGLVGSGKAIGFALELWLWLWLGWAVALAFWFCGSLEEFGLKLGSIIFPKGEVKDIGSLF